MGVRNDGNHALSIFHNRLRLLILRGAVGCCPAGERTGDVNVILRLFNTTLIKGFYRNKQYQTKRYKGIHTYYKNCINKKWDG